MRTTRFSNKVYHVCLKDQSFENKITYKIVGVRKPHVYKYLWKWQEDNKIKNNPNILLMYIYLSLSTQKCQLMKVKRKYKVLVNLAKMTLCDLGRVIFYFVIFLSFS
jgi:hypothetical protein